MYRNSERSGIPIQERPVMPSLRAKLSLPFLLVAVLFAVSTHEILTATFEQHVVKLIRADILFAWSAVSSERTQASIRTGYFRADEGRSLLVLEIGPDGRLNPGSVGDIPPGFRPK